MAEDATPRFVEDVCPQRAIGGDESRLLPQALPGRGWYSIDDDIADLALGVAMHDAQGIRRDGIHHEVA